MIREFEVKEEHLKLLSNMYFNVERGGYNWVVTSDDKRPFGNGDHLYDIWEILYSKPFDDELNTDEELMELEEVYMGSLRAVQIIMSTQSFEIGFYHRPCSYDSQKWVKGRLPNN